MSQHAGILAAQYDWAGVKHGVTPTSYLRSAPELSSGFCSYSMLEWYGDSSTTERKRGVSAEGAHTSNTSDIKITKRRSRIGSFASLYVPLNSHFQVARHAEGENSDAMNNIQYAQPIRGLHYLAHGLKTPPGGAQHFPSAQHQIHQRLMSVWWGDGRDDRASHLSFFHVRS